MPTDPRNLFDGFDVELDPRPTFHPDSVEAFIQDFQAGSGYRGDIQVRAKEDRRYFRFAKPIRLAVLERGIRKLRERNSGIRSVQNIPSDKQ